MLKDDGDGERPALMRRPFSVFFVRFCFKVPIWYDATSGQIIHLHVKPGSALFRGFDRVTLLLNASALLTFSWKSTILKYCISRYGLDTLSQIMSSRYIRGKCQNILEFYKIGFKTSLVGVLVTRTICLYVDSF